MKRAFRERAMSRLYADLESADFDVREYALFQLALMLRRSQRASLSADWTDYDSEHLSRDLLRIRLSPAEQQRIVGHLARMISSFAESRPSAFWALSEASAQVGLDTVASAIAELGDQLNDDAAYQACRALLKWLDLDDVAVKYASEVLADPGILPMLRRWSRSSEVRLAKSANAVINRAQRSGNR